MFSKRKICGLSKAHSARQNEKLSKFFVTAMSICKFAAVYLSKTPALMPAIFSDFMWRGLPEVDGVGQVYLTFDDGPHEQWTPWVMDQLEAHNGRGTFFLVGENVDRHPELYAQILERGHRVGGHTQSHTNGWEASNITYLRSYLQCQEKVESDLFRPPFGRISTAQARAVSTRSKIVMWDVLTGDFDHSRSPKSCVDATLAAVEPGSIVVMHDSEKAAPRLREVLPALLNRLDEKGWSAASL